MKLKFLHKSYFYVLLSLCLFTVSARVQADDEIRFYTGTWTEALKEAQKQNKPLFVDAYATWCGPCKYMDKNVFTDEAVAKLYNEKFVSYKLDVDQETETASYYEIRAMPTYLFIDAEGEVIYRMTGAMGAEEFVQLAESALSVPELNRRYEAGERDPEFLAEYLLLHAESEDEEILEIANTYFKTQKDEDLLSERNFQLMTHFTDQVDSREFQYYLNHIEEFKEAHSENAVEVAYQVLDRLFAEAIADEDETKLAQMETILEKMAPIIPNEQTKLISFSLYLTYYQQTEDWPRYAQKASGFIDEFGTTPVEQVINITYNFYNYVEGEENWSKALTWIKELQNFTGVNHTNQFIEAGLLFKLGQKDKALEQAQKALEQAQNQKIDPRPIEDLIKKIKAS